MELTERETLLLYAAVRYALSAPDEINDHYYGYEDKIQVEGKMVDTFKGREFYDLFKKLGF